MSVSGPWGRWWLCPHRHTTQGKSQHKNTLAATSTAMGMCKCISPLPSHRVSAAVLVVEVSQDL